MVEEGKGYYSERYQWYRDQSNPTANLPGIRHGESYQDYLIRQQKEQQGDPASTISAYDMLSYVQRHGVEALDSLNQPPAPRQQPVRRGNVHFIGRRRPRR